MGSDDRPEEPLAVLRRWEDAGGGWSVLRQDGDGVTISLLSCTRGEELDRFTTTDAAVLQHLDGRERSDD